MEYLQSVNELALQIYVTNQAIGIIRSQFSSG